jgi:CHAD domain-containing protein
MTSLRIHISSVAANAGHAGFGRRGKRDPSVLLIESLDARWRKYRKELRRCRKKCAEKTVHDLRVASRRLLNTFDMLRLIVPDTHVKSMRQGLKKQLNLFGPLRDVQVQILAVKEMICTYPPCSSCESAC